MKRCLVGALLLLASSGAAACPLCLGAEDLVYRQRAVLASLEAGGKQLKVVEVIRGENPLGGAIDSASVGHLDSGAAKKGRPLLLMRANTWESWANLGPVGAADAAWLRDLGAAKRTTDMTAREWQAHVAFMLPYLENADPMVAEIANGELASAPYSALRSLKGRLDLQAIRRWVADPQLVKRQKLYTLLLGVAGDASDAARIEQQLDAAWNAKDPTNLGPMLAADLELRGPSRMSWVDGKYIRDQDRTTQEIEAALLALSVQGGANAAISRQRVIDSYREFIGAHKPLAGFVAQDLAAWNYWDAGPEYLALMRSDLAQHPASRYAMWNYLKQSPRADVKSEIDGLAIAGP